VRDSDRMLAEDMARLYADPLGFVRYIFDWGEGDLAGWEGPDAWQAEYLAVLGEAIRTRAPGDVIKMAVKSGRGPGKSAVIAWLVLFFMSTRPNFSGVVTASGTNGSGGGGGGTTVRTGGAGSQYAIWMQTSDSAVAGPGSGGGGGNTSSASGATGGNGGGYGGGSGGARAAGAAGAGILVLTYSTGAGPNSHPSNAMLLGIG